jgi:DNA-binding IclR family transcriptional regulator
MSSRSDDEQYAIRAVDRAVDVLTAFALDAPVLSLAAVADRAGLSKPTAFRVLTSLRRRGFISQLPSGEYCLGFEIVALAAVRKGQTKIWDEALPYMRTIRDAVDETVLLSVRVGDDRFILDQVESTQPIRRVAKIGERVPLYAGAASRILLAGLSDDEVEAYLERTVLAKLGPDTLTDVDRVRSELASVRELGYAVGNNERNVGGNGIAVGVRDYTGSTVASLQITVPRERWTEDVRLRCLEVLAREASALSRHLGDMGDHPAAHLGASAPEATGATEARTTAAEETASGSEASRTPQA